VVGLVGKAMNSTSGWAHRKPDWSVLPPGGGEQRGAPGFPGVGHKNRSRALRENSELGCIGLM